MGLTDCQKEMIRAVAENDIRKAKRCALTSIAEDTTQKNKWFCTKYRNILTSEGSALISCNRSKGMSDVASKEIGRVTITLMQEFDRLPNDVIVLGATNRLDILDEAFISRFPVKKEMLPFSEQESKAMVKKFLADIGYVFSEEEIMGAIRKTQNQREVMNRVVQVLAEKIAGGYDGE